MIILLYNCSLYIAEVLIFLQKGILYIRGIELAAVLCCKSAVQLLSVFLQLVGRQWIRQSEAPCLPSDTWCVVWDPQQILPGQESRVLRRDREWQSRAWPATRPAPTCPDPPPAVASGRTQDGQNNDGTALSGSVQDIIRAHG